MALSRRQWMLGAAALQPAARPPNILFLFPDQLRHDFVEPSPGIPVRTPNVNRLARAGARFTQAITPAPLCAPARACLASGMEYARCRVPSNQVNYPLDQTTLYQRLGRGGYHVMGCGKFDLHKADLDWGLDGKRLIGEWGFSDGIDNEGKHDATTAYKRFGGPRGPFMAYLQNIGLAQAHLEDYERRKGPGATFVTPLPDEAYGDNWIARNGLALLQAAPRDKPWFLQVNFNGPHAPWDITARMEKGWRQARFPQPNRCDHLTPENHLAVRQNYAAMIENIDRWVGQFVDLVRSRGELANTLIVFSSDHGEMLGDHSLWGKTRPFHGSVGVPLVVAGVDVRRGRLCRKPVTTLDLTATFLDYAGIAKPDAMDSVSLRGFLQGKALLPRQHVFSGLGNWRMVAQDNHRFVRGYAGEPALYDLATDPMENRNIAQEHAATAGRLQSLLSDA